MIAKAEIKKLSVKVLINVGIDNLGTDEDCVEALKSKMSNIAIYVSSIFLRKDKTNYGKLFKTTPECTFHQQLQY